MHDHHHHISDTTFVGEEADILGSIGDAGMDMGESSLLILTSIWILVLKI